ncbi:blue copper protein-like [Actinidia eriantha]|uniref:blue copper protein-like n=1 Tax=Actinidia eriantha TaxID=165200 RepID=UPI00258DF432|nr:blue copper protein-like [Actinidia eriantha]
MAFKHVYIILAIIFPVMVSSKDFMVGDDKGWTINFDYQAWAKGKDFRLGIDLSCIVPPLNEALTSGHDTIVLATTGRKWYICGVGKHCASAGMKLFINVNTDSLTPSPAPLVPAARKYSIWKH